MPVILAALIFALVPTAARAQQPPSSPLAASSSIRVVEKGRTGLKWLIVGMVAAQAADIATTSLALRRGCVESTYYGLQSKWAIGGMKAGGTIVLSATLPLTHNKRPKLTKAVAWAQIASGAIGAAFNTTRLPGCR